MAPWKFQGEAAPLGKASHVAMGLSRSQCPHLSPPLPKLPQGWKQPEAVAVPAWF